MPMVVGVSFYLPFYDLFILFNAISGRQQKAPGLKLALSIRMINSILMKINSMEGKRKLHSLRLSIVNVITDDRKIRCVCVCVSATIQVCASAANCSRLRCFLTQNTIIKLSFRKNTHSHHQKVGERVSNEA